MWRRFYHVTPIVNVDSIIETGLDPDKARGKIKAIWLCDSKRLPWAISHVSFKQEVWVGWLWVCLVHVDPRELQTFRWPGIYLLKRSIEIYEIYPAQDMINRGPRRMAGNRSKI